MTFEEIIQPLIYGKKVRRSSWSDEIYMESNGDRVRITSNTAPTLPGFCFTDKCFSLDDVTADDWELYR